MHEIIKGPWPNPQNELDKVFVLADRLTLAKRRWHTVAGNIDFGFDLSAPLQDGDIIFESGVMQYVLQQKPEPILMIPLGGPATAARRAWSLGNLHFPIEIRDDSIRVPDDPAVRLFLEREHIHYEVVNDVFRAVRTVAGHSHGHAHSH